MTPFEDWLRREALRVYLEGNEEMALDLLAVAACQVVEKRGIETT